MHVFYRTSPCPQTAETPPGQRSRNALPTNVADVTGYGGPPQGLSQPAVDEMCTSSHFRWLLEEGFEPRQRITITITVLLRRRVAGAMAQ
jgi:hypothetical protein